MKHQDEVSVEIESLAQTGEGVAHLAGRLVLVPGTLPGERVRVRLGHRGAAAERIALESSSPERLEPRCPVVDQCGGCSWQHVPASVQREARIGQLRRALAPSARSVSIEYVAAPDSYGYRARARLAWDQHGRSLCLGFRTRGQRHVVDIPQCPVLDASLETALNPLREVIARLGRSGELSIALGKDNAPVVSLHPDTLPSPEGFEVPGLLCKQGFAGVALWPPGATTPTVEGDPRPVIPSADGMPLWLAAEGFSQANSKLNLALATRVVDLADVRGCTVLELYAGAGNFTVLLARQARRVIAVESDRAASAALSENARARGLTDVTVVAEDAALIVEKRRADVVVLDPPRAGARDVCVSLARRAPHRCVYVSCDPATLGRDLELLSHGMTLASLTAFEMFPQTPHVEVAALLHRRGSIPQRA